MPLRGAEQLQPQAATLLLQMLGAQAMTYKRKGRSLPSATDSTTTPLYRSMSYLDGYKRQISR